MKNSYFLIKASFLLALSFSLSSAVKADNWTCKGKIKCTGPKENSVEMNWSTQAPNEEEAKTKFKTDMQGAWDNLCKKEPKPQVSFQCSEEGKEPLTEETLDLGPKKTQKQKQQQKQQQEEKKK
jgi:hypothetical protein